MQTKGDKEISVQYIFTFKANLKLIYVAFIVFS